MKQLDDGIGNTLELNTRGEQKQSDDDIDDNNRHEPPAR
jgi:hypothetical protein